MPSNLVRFAAATLMAALAVLFASSLVEAEEATQSPAAPAPSAQSPAQTPAAPQSAPAPASPAPATQPPTSGADTAPENPKPAETSPGPSEGTGEIVELPARPFAYVEGKAERDEIFSAIRASLKTVKAEMDKVGLKPSGRPIADFVESDESGFRYHAGYPLEAAPEGKTALSEAVKLGQTPAGKAMRFVHQGAYADIDATYDAITAYLDEKGIDAKDDFVEEYANDAKDVDDPTLQVNIFVLLR